MKDKKKIVIGALCALIMIMAVGYALLSQQLSINGTANITSTWKIEITNITEKERHGGVTEKSKSYDAMTANFNVGFTSPGDYIIYEVEVTNSGTLDAVIERVNVETNDNPAIIYTTSGIQRGTEIPHNSKKYLTVKIEYDSSVTSQPQTNNNALTLQLFTEQNLGQVPPNYDYVVGDKITYKGADWYVIVDSPSNQDYVTLMKETVLTNEELGTYAISSGHDTMIYSDYEENKVDYVRSKIKEAIEAYMEAKLMTNDLKEIDGYKIRLITSDELETNFGFASAQAPWNSSDIYYPIPNNTPNFIHSDYGENQNSVGGYWTMSKYRDSNSQIWVVNNSMGGYVGPASTSAPIYGVRPVINLLKSAIE